MLIEANTAKILASIIFISTQGAENLTPQLPLQVVDRGESWLVKGTPYTDKRLSSKNIAHYIFIKKNDAEIVGIGSDARIILTNDEKKKWMQTFNPADYDRMFGPRTRFEPGGETFAINMLMNNALYGGLINKPADAIAYAHALMQTTPRWEKTPAGALQADERDHTWHITTTLPASAASVEVMSFSRETGKVLSGDL